MHLKMNIEEIESFLTTHFPQINGKFAIEALHPGRLTLAMNAQESDLRPGGTVSGPSMFALADCAFYIATLSLIGPKELTVTTNANINFLRKPVPGKLYGDARVLKLGRSLSVGDVVIYNDDADKPVAHATMTYAIPPETSKS